MQTKRTVTELKRQLNDVQQWRPSISAMEHAIQTLSEQSGCTPTVREIIEELKPEVLAGREAHEWFASHDLPTCAFEGDADETPFDCPSVPEGFSIANPLLGSKDDPCATSGGASTQWYIPSGWIVRASELEEAVSRLLFRLSRTPSDAELAKELQLSNALYLDMLKHLHGLNVGAVDGHNRTGGSEIQAVPRSRDEAVFQCIHGGLRDLLTGATQGVSDAGRLVLSFDYSDDNICYRDISVKLELMDHTRNDALASASIHLCAELFNVQRDRDLGGPAIRKRAKGLDRKIAHVVLRGSQNGWLSTRKCWERSGKRASWNREFTRSYSFDGTETLTEYRSREEYRLKLES